MQTTTPLCTLALVFVSLQATADSQQNAKGFMEQSKLSVLSRNFYFNRDFRDAPAGDQSYREEWAQGILADFSSGYTQGTVGFGLDAHAYLGLKLDSGKGRSGAGLLPVGDDDRADDSFSELGGAVKMRISATELRYGQMRTESPVFMTSDSRLLPETATGFLLTSKEIKDLAIEAGHFTASKYRNSSNHDDDLLLNYGENRIGKSIDYLGGTYSFTDDLTASLYASEFENTWRQYYSNLNYVYALSKIQALDVDFNLYKTDDTGKAYQGEINNTAYSFAAGYSVGAHKFTLAYQKVEGDTPFDYVGGDSIVLANAVNYSDFNGAKERSYQARYDLNLAAYGVPGLKFSVRYITGDNIDGTKADPNGGYAGLQGDGGKHWERNVDVRYVVQSGTAKDLSLRLRQATHRANEAQGEGDVDEVRFIVEYPLQLL